MKPFQRFLMSLTYLIFALSLAVILTVILSPYIYQVLIDVFGLTTVSGLSKFALMENYHYLLEYLLEWGQKDFSMPYFSSSAQGTIHFEEVRNLVRIDMIIAVVSFIAALFSLLYTKKQKWKYKMQGLFPYLYVFPLFVLVFIIVAFDQFFILFHQLLFNNDMWIFNPLYDPVITVLPQELFMVLFLLAIFIFELIIMLLHFINKRLY